MRLLLRFDQSRTGIYCFSNLNFSKPRISNQKYRLFPSALGCEGRFVGSYVARQVGLKCYSLDFQARIDWQQSLAMIFEWPAAVYYVGADVADKSMNILLNLAVGGL